MSLPKNPKKGAYSTFDEDVDEVFDEVFQMKADPSRKLHKDGTKSVSSYFVYNKNLGQYSYTQRDFLTGALGIGIGGWLWLLPFALVVLNCGVCGFGLFHPKSTQFFFNDNDRVVRYRQGNLFLNLICRFLYKKILYDEILDFLSHQIEKKNSDNEQLFKVKMELRDGNTVILENFEGNNDEALEMVAMLRGIVFKDENLQL